MRMCILATAAIVLTGAAQADAIGFGGQTFDGVYVEQTQAGYCVRFPASGAVIDVPAALVEPDSVVLSPDPATRAALLDAWTRKHEALETAAGQAVEPAPLPRSRGVVEAEAYVDENGVKQLRLRGNRVKDNGVELRAEEAYQAERARIQREAALQTQRRAAGQALAADEAHQRALRELALERQWLAVEEQRLRIENQALRNDALYYAPPCGPSWRSIYWVPAWPRRPHRGRDCPIALESTTTRQGVPVDADTWRGSWATSHGAAHTGAGAFSTSPSAATGASSSWLTHHGGLYGVD